MSTLEVHELRRPTDLHSHLRHAELMKAVADVSTRLFLWVLAMPNLAGQEIVNGRMALQYKRELMKLIHREVKLWMTLYLTPETTPEDIAEAYELLQGLVSVKLYFRGEHGTTNSGRGLVDIRQGYEVFAKMQELDMVLNIHGELLTDPFDPQRAEQLWLPQLGQLLKNFPRLRIVLEHVSSAEAVEFVRNGPSNLAASITVQHMVLLVEDALRDVHCSCLPQAKTREDQLALINGAASGDAKFFLGTDSAPHLIEDKLSKSSKGVFSGPVAMAILAEVFEATGRPDWLERLERFASLNGPRFYGIAEPAADDVIKLVKRDWQVPAEIGGVVPLFAGRTVSWQVEDKARAA